MGISSKLKKSLRKMKQKRKLSKLKRKFSHNASQINFDWDWSAENYNRIATVNNIIRRFNKNKIRYLEIGCCENELFNAVCADTKIGVDPIKGGTHRMTSDEFFAKTNEKFDVIFIDGLHEYHQVRNDTINALHCLSDGGVIAFHDFLPRNWLEQHVPQLYVPRLNTLWTGDCWKVACELTRSEGLEFKIIKIDHGVGILRKASENFRLADMRKELDGKQFDYYAEAVKSFPIVSWQEFDAWL